MGMPDRFVRIPNDLLRTLLRTRLSGIQWSILCWIIGRTFGLNRNTTPFSWYRIAIELALDRGGVVRAGRDLLHGGILYLEGDKSGIRRIGFRPQRSTPKADSLQTVAVSDNHDR